MNEGLQFTAAEIAFVLREPLKAVKKVLDDGPIHPKLISKAGGTMRAVDRSDLLYLVALRSLREDLTPKARSEFYHALKTSPVDHLREVRFGKLSVVIEEFKIEVEDRARELAALADKVTFHQSGEVMLKATDIEVHRIAALMAGGASADEIRADYPSLSLEQISDAQAYATAYPKMGRPFPRSSFKRAIEGAGLEALDEVLDDQK